MERINLCGSRFGKLTVLKKVEHTGSGNRNDYWLCLCDCGNETIVLGSNLLRGHTKSCGCLKERDLTGKHIGKLTVICRSDRYAPRGNRKNKLWKCLCDCGNIVYRATDTLSADRESSCAECAAKHNAALARENAGFIDGTQVSKIKEMKLSASNTSGCRGVSYDSRRNLWEATIKFKNHKTRLGYYKNYADAVKARKEAENKVFGGFLESISE